MACPFFLFFFKGWGDDRLHASYCSLGGGEEGALLPSQRRKEPERLTYEEKGRGIATSIFITLPYGTGGKATSILLILLILVQAVGRWPPPLAFSCLRGGEMTTSCLLFPRGWGGGRPPS